jgi:aminoglycoside phosphotransferase (APT) family kinase protein
VSGIIDWGDAAIGDPAVDFAGLYTWYGEIWLESVLESYLGPLDSEVISRTRYLATCFAIHTLALGQDLDRPRWIKAGGEALLLHNQTSPFIE